MTYFGILGAFWDIHICNHLCCLHVPSVRSTSFVSTLITRAQVLPQKGGGGYSCGDPISRIPHVGYKRVYVSKEATITYTCTHVYIYTHIYIYIYTCWRSDWDMILPACLCLLVKRDSLLPSVAQDPTTTQELWVKPCLGEKNPQPLHAWRGPLTKAHTTGAGPKECIHTIVCVTQQINRISHTYRYRAWKYINTYIYICIYTCIIYIYTDRYIL